MHADDHSQSEIRLTVRDEAAMLILGERLASALARPGISLWLEGDLGAGKTTLARGLLRGLGYVGRVKSPTYTLVELYPFSRFNLYHFDLYRLVSASEWEDAGLREYFNDNSLCLVEWPDRAGDLLPAPDLRIHIAPLDEGRVLRLSGRLAGGLVAAGFKADGEALGLS